MAPRFLQIKFISAALVLLTISLSVLVLTYSYVSRQENRRLLQDSVLHDFISSTSSKFTMLPGLSKTMAKRRKIAMVNMEAEEVIKWRESGRDIEEVKFAKVSPEVRWEHLFPSGLYNEDQVATMPKCPEIPLPEFKEDDGDGYELVVAKIPCRYPSEGWARDVARLQVLLAAAKLASRSSEGVMVLLLSPCRPMVELFRCDDLVKRRGDEWLFRPDLHKLKLKLSLPLGACSLVLPLLKRNGHAGERDLDVNYNFSAVEQFLPKPEITAYGNHHPFPREAYATVIHSSDCYVCGAIALARSLLHTVTTRDLLLLLHTSSPKDETYRRQRLALIEAGWKIHEVQRLRYPHAKKDAYNEWNYTKLRLWQLTQYDKIIYLDADMLVLKNLDRFFAVPQLSAAVNHNPIFNSGLMVIEPSSCMFKLLTDQVSLIESYNGGDQGFLNEIFAWWHRLPQRLNMLKVFPKGMSASRLANNTRLIGADPPTLYGLHYLGLKPWLCYRDYDCNWNVDDQRIFANDVAHRLWWQMHDRLIPKSLQPFCELSKKRKQRLLKDAERARKAGYQDRHWMKTVTDPRQY